MHGHSARENRETPPTPGGHHRPGRVEKAMSRMSTAHYGESDGRIVPTKGPNADARGSAEAPEGRRPTKENTTQATAPRTQSRTSESSALLRVREAARRDKRTRFTALLHHVTVAPLQASFYALKREAAWSRRRDVDGLRDEPGRTAGQTSRPRASGGRIGRSSPMSYWSRARLTSCESGSGPRPHGSMSDQ